MLRSAFFILSTVAILIASFFLLQKENERKSLKRDYIELSRAKYGLFNVDEWKKYLIVILSRKVDEIEVNESTEQEVKRQVSAFLYKTIDDFERDYRAANERKSYFGISLQNLGADFFELFEGIRDQVPKITNEIVAYLKGPENKERLKSYLSRKVEKYAKETFSAVDYTLHDELLRKYGQENRGDTLTFLHKKMREIKQSTVFIKGSIYFAASILIVLLFFSRSLYSIDFVAAGLSILMILFAGLYLPMIDIDARISEFSFTVLGEPIVFRDQVIYFKSKSILEVVTLMLQQSQWDIIVVGILIFSFSVLLPLSKLVVFFLSQVNHRIRNGGVSKFLLGKTGKWSMADVLVVAIFMSYIGFSSILSEQLSQLNNYGDSLRVLTTNYSELNTGFFLFFTFVLLSIALSEAAPRKVS